MSLSTFIKESHIREKFNSEFSIPTLKFNADLKAPPLTKNYSLIGTAFDYLLRFYIQYLNKGKYIHTQPWIASFAYQSLSSRLKNCGNDEILIGYKMDKTINANYLLELIECQHNQTLINYDNFIKDGELSNEFISNIIFLSKLEAGSRGHLIDSNFDSVNPLDIQDIKNLFSIINKDLFIINKLCFLNPFFGRGSDIVMGADADLIIDDTIIEIKTTKELKLKRIDLNQLLGYYILYLIGGITGDNSKVKIKNIAIYFSRYGILWTIPLKNFGNKNKFDEFKYWFIDNAPLPIIFY